MSHDRAEEHQEILSEGAEHRKMGCSSGSERLAAGVENGVGFGLLRGLGHGCALPRGLGSRQPLD
jgi:hypothetical protein